MLFCQDRQSLTGPADVAYNALPHDLRHADFDTILQTAKDALRQQQAEEEP